MKRKMSKILTTFAVVLGMAILASVMSVIATNSNTKTGELTIETQKYQAEEVKNFINFITRNAIYHQELLIDLVLIRQPLVIMGLKFQKKSLIN